MARTWIFAAVAAAAQAQWADSGLSQVAFGANGICSSDNIPYPEIAGLKVLSLSAHQLRNHSIPRNLVFGQGNDPTENLNFCNVTVTYTHPGWNDEIHVTTYLPTENWNGRFQGSGGGGWTTGGESMSQMTMLPALQLGFAVSTTDGGHSSNVEDGMQAHQPWMHTSPGNVNWPLLLDFSYVALHDMATIGKALVESFYGTPPKYSYFNGFSTGGRQGHMLSQRYPEDFDGILSGFPAINMPRFVWAALWPWWIMEKHGVYPRPCEFEAITAAAMKACDGLDGVEDGVISMPSRCHFDPHVLVGKRFDCEGTESVFTSEAADVLEASWTGPHSSTGEFQWYGLGRDSHTWGYMGALKTVCGEDGKCAGVPFTVSDTWVRYFVAKDPELDISTLTHQQWDDLFTASAAEYESVIGTADPDLSRFRRANGKMLVWHGMADQLIPMNGTVEYANRVLARDPRAHDYYRLFLAPGADHLFNGMMPGDAFMSLVDWVEQGKAPETLRAAGPNAYGTRLERDICMYPQVQHYKGGDPKDPSSFICV